ncbi:MAG: sulfite exporter TauE/SafE family protein [Campylobacterota bacterium]|nr:sulfite exporter TauE/SafE family protein [Campylobacterota bacterium]
MVEYLLYFLLTLFLSSIFSIAGLGSAVALVPGLNMAGLAFDLSRASGLFVNTVTTITTSGLNLKKKLFDFKFVAPLVISSSIFAFVGAKLSFLVDTETLKMIFAYVLFIIASMILFFKKPAHSESAAMSRPVLLIAGSIGGVFSGFLGIGGGSIIAPILLLAGYDAKKIAIGISFVIPFSSIVAFTSYAGNMELDYTLLTIVGVGAYMGGMIGNYILHFKVSAAMIKKILAIALYSIAVKMLLG